MLAHAPTRPTRAKGAGTQQTCTAWDGLRRQPEATNRLSIILYAIAVLMVRIAHAHPKRASMLDHMTFRVHRHPARQAFYSAATRAPGLHVLL